jgi:hypothetical protein
MKLKIFKTSWIWIALMFVSHASIAQDTLEYQSHELDARIKQIEQKINDSKAFKKLDLALRNLDKRLNGSFKNMEMSLEYLNQLPEDFESFPEQDNLIEKIKNYSKSYAVGESDKLKIDNQFGKITITTWNKNEFKVDVQIKAAAKDAQTAQMMLDGIHINDEKSGSLISFTTANNQNANWKRNNVRKLEINYTIYMPATNPLDLSNKYGAIVMPDFGGQLNINCTYGSFIAQNLSNTSNNINVRYGSVDLKEINGGSLDLAYSSLKIDVANNLNSSISYGSAKINQLKSSGNIDLRYSGGFNLGGLDHKLKSLNINAAYSSLSLDFNNNENFDFDVSVNYAGFEFPKNKTTITEQTPEDERRRFNPSKNFKGYFGKASNQTKVTIRSNYGAVKFN